MRLQVLPSFLASLSLTSFACALPLVSAGLLAGCATSEDSVGDAAVGSMVDAVTADHATVADSAPKGDGGVVILPPGDTGAPLEASHPADGTTLSGDTGSDAPAKTDAPAGNGDAGTDAKLPVDAGGTDAPGTADTGSGDTGAPDSGPGGDAGFEAGFDASVGDAGVDGGTDAGVDAPAASCTTDHLVLAEIQTRGLAGGDDEFIDLYNPTSAAVTLDSTWTVSVRSNSSNAFTSRWKGTSKTIPALGHYLLVGAAYSGTVAKDDSLSSGVTDAAAVRLLHSGTTVDAVCFAYSTSTSQALQASGYDCPGTPATNPHKDSTASDLDEGIERGPGGAAGNCTDTGNSSADWKTVNPSTPRDTSSAATP